MKILQFLLISLYILSSYSSFAGGGCTPATNTSCATAIALTANAACISGTTCSGGTQSASTCLYTGSQCVWYSFTATATNMVVSIGNVVSSGCHISSNVYSSTGACAGLTQISCQSGAPLDDIHSLSGLIIGRTYYIQVCYAPGGACGNGGSAEFCIRAFVPPPPCNTCASPCGTAAGYATTPSVSTVTANCTTDPFSPVLAAGSTHTFCYSFQATATSVDFNVIITSTCGNTGNVTNFSWSLYNASCGGAIQTGTLASLTFNGLSVGNNYVFCYTFTVPSGCTHSQHCPYFVGATVVTCPTAAINYAGAPFCSTLSGSQAVTLTGTGAYTGGTYSSTTGLTINSSTGAITPSTSTPGTYTVTYTIPAAGTCAAVQVTTTVTISPPPVMTSATTATICSGQTLSIPLTSNPTGSTFTWIATDNTNVTGESLTNQTTNTLNNTLTNTAATAQVVTYTVTPTLNGCVGTPQTVNVTVNPRPVMTSANTATICSGQTVSIPLTSSPTGSTFTWIATDNTNVTGESLTTQTTSTLSNTLTNNTTSVQVVSYTITPTLNGCAGTPQTVNVTVNPRPIMTSASTATICSGQTVSIPLTSNPTGSTYNWIATDNTNVTGESTTTQTTSTLSNTLTNTTSTVQTVTYTVTPTLNGCVGTAQTVTVTVNPIPTVTDPADQTLCANTATTAVTFTGNNASTVYNWTNNTTSIGLAASGTGNIASFTATNTGSTAVTATITVTPTLNGCTGTAQTFTITVNPVPTVVDPADQTLCAGATTAAVTFTGNSASTTYNWTNNNTTIGLVASGTGNIAAFTTINTGSTPQVATITVTPTLNGCTGTPQTFTITVNPIPTVLDPADQTLCANTATTAVTFTGNNASTVYNWTNNTTSIGLAASGTGNIASFTATNTGSTAVTATITVTPTLNGCTGTAQTFTITVNPVPTVVDPADQTLCAGVSTTAVTFTGNSASTTYNWTNNNTSIGLAASGTGNIAAFTTINTGSTPQVATITVAPTLNGCTGTPQTFTITVNPIPTVLDPTDQTLCANTATTAVTFTGNNASTVYNWTNNTTSIGLAASGTGNIASFTATNTGSTAVTATVTVTPTLNGCTGTPQTFTITVNPVPTVVDPADQLLCAGENTAAVTFTGNSASTTYNWTNDNTTIGLAASGTGNIASFTTVNTGTTNQVATITVTPVLGSCTGTAQTFTITVRPLPTVVDPADQTLCANTATTTVTFSGNIGLTTYSWTNDNTSIGLAASGTGTINSFTALNAGTTTQVATITVTPSFNGCTGTPQTFTITVNPIPVAGITNNTGTTVITCTQPTISVTGTGGGSYSWSGGLGTNADATISLAGTYTLTVTGLGGCTDTEAITITEDITPPTAAITNNTGTTVLTCTATSISVTATGGVSYAWDGGLGTNANATITAAGTYTVTVTGANGCTSTAAITITADPSAPIADITNNTGTTVLTCTTTSISVTATGGVSYAWDNGLGTNANATITAPGTYTVTATAANGCTATASITVTQDIAAPTAGITNNTGATELTCTLTSISVTATGGVSYSWSGSLGTNADAIITAAGTYTVTVTGANGCTSTAAITITADPSIPTAGITNNTGTTVLTCTTTSISVTATGGVSYSWDNGLGTNADATITSPGTYTVTATAANGCTATASITVTQDIAAPTAGITNNTGSTVLTCTLTSISVTATGGVSYAWDGGLGTNANATITAAGTYTVTVTGANGCTSTAAITITADPSAPIADITNNTGTTVLTCTTTSISVTATGGVSYAWDNGLGTNANATITAPGTYTVTATAANGCTATASITVTQDIAAPTAGITNNTGATELTCTLTSISVTATGGVSYSWSGGLGTNADATITAAGTYTVTVTGANGCTSTAAITITADPSIPTAGITNNTGTTVLTCTTTSISVTATGGVSYSWDNGLGTNADATITSPGTYTVTATAANGCTATASITVTQDIAAPTAGITNNTGSTVLTCTLTSISVTATGGVSYAWDGGLGTNANATITAAGTYTVTVTGANGCTSTAAITVTSDTGISDPVTTLIQPTCATPTGTITVSSPLGANYQYSIGGAYQSSATFTGLSAGTYTVTAQDMTNSCVSAPLTVTIDPIPDSPSITLVTQNNITCSGGSNGSIEIAITGGAAPYTTSWNPSAGTGTSISGLTAGNYVVTVTDDNGCSSTASYTITAPAALAITGVANNLICGQSLGSITTTASGGTGPYTYLWNPASQTTTGIDNLSSGNYSVVVTDANGCVANSSFVIGLTGNLDLEVDPDFAAILEGESVDLSVSGATSYVWSPSTGLSCNDCPNPVATPSSTTTYFVTGTDVYGCTGATSVTIFVTENCEAFFVPNIFSPNGTGPEANNTLCVAGGCILELRYQVFNRWGEKIFETTDPDICWDGVYRGEPVGSGVYAYKVYARLSNGEIIERAGSLTVVY
jgi:large repetitive protein